jgi:hypothetical protein
MSTGDDPVAESESDKLNEETATIRGRQVQELQADFADCKDQHMGERFMWIAVVMILFDALVFPPMRTWTGPLAIFAVQLLLLFMVARRYGVKELAEWVDRLVAMAKASIPGRRKL